jgi:hypothetical protein
MLERIHFKNFLTIIGLASLLNLGTVSLPSSVRAQPTDSGDSLQLPERRIGGAPRDPQSSSLLARAEIQNSSCNFRNNQLVALIPKNLLGVTAAESPTLYFQVPQIAPTKTIEFVLRDRDDRLVYEKALTPSGKAGLMSLQIPTSDRSQSLKIDQEYHWYFSVICNPKDRAKDVVVEGLLQRVQLPSTLANQLDKAALIEQVKFYQEAHLWQETLNVLAQLKRAYPNDPTVLAMWTKLLESVDLDRAIAKEPLID